jgi:hypothetical protein
LRWKQFSELCKRYQGEKDDRVDEEILRIEK